MDKGAAESPIPASRRKSSHFYGIRTLLSIETITMIEAKIEADGSDMPYPHLSFENGPQRNNLTQYSCLIVAPKISEGSEIQIVVSRLAVKSSQ